MVTPPVVTPQAPATSATAADMAVGVGSSVGQTQAASVFSAQAVNPQANPLPTFAAAGDADTGSQLVVGGFAAFAALLALGAGAATRSRRGVA